MMPVILKEKRKLEICKGREPLGHERNETTKTNRKSSKSTENTANNELERQRPGWAATGFQWVSGERDKKQHFQKHTK